MTESYPLLSSINDPSGLRKLNRQELPALCNELRNFIIDIVSCNPGHLGSSLGVVELTVALHYVYNTPFDKIIWDVGHQAYGHKILTGRRDRFHTNRKYNGLSGFPRMSESEYDAFGTGHSSTSISAALGMAVASQKKEEERQVVAIIGDGAMTAGLAFEGLNNAGMAKSNLLVILNDNNIAIDENVGALKEYLLDITTSHTYNKLKDGIWNILGKISRKGPDARSFAAQLEAGLKSTILDRSNLFEGLNFRYFGPIDGHDVLHLSQVLSDLKRIPGPKLLHCITVKGKGYRFAEEDRTKFHSPGAFDKKTGQVFSSSPPDSPPSYQDVFGETILELAQNNPLIYAITPAMTTGCSLRPMMESLPERTFDVGIAEQHAVTFAAGLATQGLIPYCNIYSTFLQRAYDQVIHDVAIQNLHVVFCIDRGGLVGADGATHHGFFDLAFMRNIPNMIVSAPMDETELRNMLYTAQLEKIKSPFSIRYPRSQGIHKEWRKPFVEIEVGKARAVSRGEDVAILSIGHPGNYVRTATETLAAEGISAAHWDMRFVSPIDTETLHEVFRRFKKVITVEDGILKGGFGSAVAEFMADNNYSAGLVRLGIPDYFVEQGTNAELAAECGFDVNGIIMAVRSLLQKNNTGHITDAPLRLSRNSGQNKDKHAKTAI